MLLGSVRDHRCTDPMAGGDVALFLNGMRKTLQRLPVTALGDARSAVAGLMLIKTSRILLIHDHDG
ncbi:MAG: hypothetical protein ACJ72M_04725 [Propionibacteriaceae bacterium]